MSTKNQNEVDRFHYNLKASPLADNSVLSPRTVFEIESELTPIVGFAALVSTRYGDSDGQHSVQITDVCGNCRPSIDAGNNNRNYSYVTDASASSCGCWGGRTLDRVFGVFCHNVEKTGAIDLILSRLERRRSRVEARSTLRKHVSSIRGLQIKRIRANSLGEDE